MTAGNSRGIFDTPPAKRDWVGLFFLMVLMAVISAGCFGPYPSDFDGRYTYHLSLKTSNPVRNVTFVIPLPVQNKTPRIGGVALDESQFLQYRSYTLIKNINAFRIFNAQDAGYPPDFRFSIIRRDNGTFLRMDADTLQPERPVDVWFEYEIEPSFSYLDIDTINPVAHEPVFLPKINFSRNYHNTYFFRKSFGVNQILISQTAAEFTYDIPIYASYMSENRSTAVTIESWVEGRNHWIRGYDLHGINSYKDRYSITLANESEGWAIAQGSLILANGDYPTEKASSLPGVPPVEWTQKTENAQFSPRINHESLVYNNRIWVIGGVTQDGDIKNDVWYSDDGAHWIPANMSAAFPPRSGSCSVVFNDTMWVIGGRVRNGGYTPENSIYKNDIWYSSDGTIWSQAMALAVFPGRTGHQCLVFNNMLWVIGGTAEQDFVYLNKTFANGTHVSMGKIGQVNFSDVWYSADGVNWAAATQDTAFGERFNHRAAVFRNKMWVINGEGYRDIWSSADGREWVQINDNPPFNFANMTLEKFGVVVFDDRLWLIGGEISGAGSTRFWYSTDGISWTDMHSEKSLDFRWEQSVVAFKNRIWLIGGRDGLSKTYKNDVWYTPRDMDFEPVKPPWEK